MILSKRRVRGTLSIIFLLLACFLEIKVIRAIPGAVEGDTLVWFSTVMSSGMVLCMHQTLAYLCCIIVAALGRHIYLAISCAFSLAMSLTSVLTALTRTEASFAIPGSINGFISTIAIILIWYQIKTIASRSITDYSTGLYNMRGCLYELDRMIAAKKECALIYIQLDSFRTVNDDYGHDAGDKVLSIVARKISDILGKHDVGCRCTGAEFAVIISKPQNVTEFAERIINEITKKIVLNHNGEDIDCYLGCNVGIALFPDHASNTNELIRCADIALLKSLEKNVNNITMFEDNMLSELHRQKEVEQLIKDGLEKELFFMVYQPQFEIAQKKLRGFETLVRLRKEDGSTVSPGVFIPIAEKSDLIEAIDRYVLYHAMLEFREPVIRNNKEIIISVNSSAKEMAKDGYGNEVLELIKKADFPPQCLEIEITEYSFAESMSKTVENINVLRKAGVQIALDDFGTGYTSLAQLLNLPINLLKIDKSLIDDIEQSSLNLDFVNAIVYMGHLMGCDVISEGVEKVTQLELLNRQGCDYVQGYVWGKPMEFEAAVQLLYGTANC